MQAESAVDELLSLALDEQRMAAQRSKIDAVFSNIDADTLNKEDFVTLVRRSVSEFQSLLDEADAPEADQLALLCDMAKTSHTRGVAYLVNAITCILSAVWTNYFRDWAAVEDTLVELMASLRIACDAEEMFKSKYKRSIESVSDNCHAALVNLANSRACLLVCSC